MNNVSSHVLLGMFPEFGVSDVIPEEKIRGHKLITDGLNYQGSNHNNDQWQLRIEIYLAVGKNT